MTLRISPRLSTKRFVVFLDLAKLGRGMFAGCREQSVVSPAFRLVLRLSVRLADSHHLSLHAVSSRKRRLALNNSSKWPIFRQSGRTYYA